MLYLYFACLSFFLFFFKPCDYFIKKMISYEFRVQAKVYNITAL